MLFCVDTSGAMRGGAEAVAKAVVLEAVRSAVLTQPADARSWLVTACKGQGPKRAPKAENFDAKDYGSGVEDL